MSTEALEDAAELLVRDVSDDEHVIARVRSLVRQAADARWGDLKDYLRARITTETPVMEGFRGEITGAASGGIVSACRDALAEMTRLEAQR